MIHDRNDARNPLVDCGPFSVSFVAAAASSAASDTVKVRISSVIWSRVALESSMGLLRYGLPPVARATVISKDRLSQGY